MGITQPISLIDLVDTMLEKRLKPVDPYEDYVPIIKTEEGYIVYLTDDIADPSLYNKLVHTLETATEDQTIRLVINTGGGDSDTAYMLASFISQSKATVVGVATSMTASAGSLILFSCDEIEISPTASVLIHVGSTAFAGKTSDATEYHKYSTKHQKQIYEQIYSCVLSVAEIRKAVSGTEVWLSGEDVQKRLLEKGSKLIQGGN